MSEEELWLHLETEIGKNQLLAKINKAIETLEEQERHIKEADKEIERLNNIINELEKELKNRIKNVPDTMAEVYEDESILNKLQELKGSDKE